MKKSSVIFCAFIASLALTGCAAPERWYALEEHAGNPNAAWSICVSKAFSIVSAIQCPADNIDGGFCKRDKQATLARGFNSGTHWAFRACMAEKGFLPCSQGGLHLPECQ